MMGSKTFRIIAVAAMFMLAMGCQKQPRSQQLARANQAYQAGDYPAAYSQASRIARSINAQGQDAAAYVAGLSAEQMGKLYDAERYLQQAARSKDKALAADALASLGLVHHKMGRYAAAARELNQAAASLDGEQKAHAYFYAGIAQQKLDRWPQARTSLLLARKFTRNASLRSQIDDQLAVTGYTVQLGAYSDADNARQAAQSVAQQAVDARLGAPRMVPGTDRYGRPLTLVQVGRFASFQAAQTARQKLSHTQAIIVPLKSQ